MTTIILRSTSTPILNSCIPHSNDSSPQSETLHHIPTTRSITLSASSSSFLSPIEGGGGDRGGWDNKDRGGSRFWDSNKGNDSTELYYRTMIEANPGNSLFLSNYARYLKEVRADYVKAEEYCERAILTNPNDANVLSMYADLLWHIHKNAPLAETYFHQAVQAAPDDCYVLASYAHFLWNAEEEDAVEESSVKSPNLFHGAAAAS